MDNIDYVKTLYAAFTRGDIDKLVSEMDPNISWFSNVDPAIVPRGGERRGPAEARTFFHEVSAEMDIETFRPTEFFGGKDFVVVRVLMSGRMKSSGARFENELLHVFKLRNGKIAEFREYADTHAEVQAYFGGDVHAAGLPSDRPAARPH